MPCRLEPTRLNLVRFAACCSWLAIPLTLLFVPSAAGDDRVEYLRDIKPLLAKRCYACHGGLQQRGGLRLDTALSLRQGGESGAAVDLTHPEESLLLRAVTGEAGFRMPPENEGAPLSAAEVDLLRRWLAAGAVGPDQETPQPSPAQYWSYQAPQETPLPTIARRSWPRVPLDTFIAAEHEAQGLSPSDAASREIYLRRVYLDLVGWPPHADELAEFLADESPDAEARVVDRLLAHPAHGERWGRHWMDIWRYSDWYGSRGINEIRYSQRHIWRWRDWIVKSLNHDQPYARMLEAMLAADELTPTDPEALAATGYLGRNWYKFDRNVWLFETVEQTGQAFLGMTLRCARCHDHKFDPISQEDYYRFRAAFEPHDVRTDPLSPNGPTEKDATLGTVPKEGIARVYDRQLDVPTYVFQRGDSRYPDEQRPVAPGVPEVFRLGQIQANPIPLPVEAYYPALRADFSEVLIASARAEWARQQGELTKLEQAAREADERLATAEARVAGKAGTRPEVMPLVRTRFSPEERENWKVVSGQWSWDNSRLAQTQVTSFATLVLQQPVLPEQFRVRLKYRPLRAGSLRSVGFSYDYIDQGNSQDVYTSTGDARQSLQAFHRLNGQQFYPTPGIVPVQLKVEQETIVEAEVRGTHLTLSLQGETRLQYPLPVPRREGKFALWVHDGAAEFLELEITPLMESLEDLRRAARTAHFAIRRQEKRMATAAADVTSIEARVAAERARLDMARETERATLTQAASAAHYAVLLARQEETLCDAEFAAGEARLAGGKEAIEKSEMQLAAAQAAVDQARQAHAKPDGKYDPVGTVYPSQSTGRRAALARWITTPRHPRTSRIAVNHAWLRHFGQALVPSVANFGLQGERPSHPQLLDWLAIEFERLEWRWKPLHRDMVLSATYRQSSQDNSGTAAMREIDPDNRYLWRANTRRMEAEVVRDSLLSVADLLDSRLGGAEIPEGEGQTVTRRSLYFRNTPNEKMRFLETFDVADPNACYRRRESVVPQQALVLMNSSLAIDAARTLAERLSAETPGVALSEQTRFVELAFSRVLSRSPSVAERDACVKFLVEQSASANSDASFPVGVGPAPRRPASTDPRQRAREDLVHVLLNHNDFVTIR